ncbi:hypothetical protein [Geomonas subterranea]|uniref:Fibronectin type III domain-containing protein n=1 Tax=Geomonas subterranea TaxID=2847989 RepID=A0ABX8LL86_9BACT|nr:MULTISPECIES: hypothetical protein [Geomonas]QXE92111.1 hypothetical protein KP001_06165 [Geomonas subterranea]QXM09793.1 hypothetical protein KP002_01330 [Geomonas subterranea]
MPHNDLPHAEMVAKSEEVRQVLTPELYAYLISLIPTPDRYAALHTRFESSLTGYLKGIPEQVKECEEARVELNQAITVINGFSKAVSPIDPTVMNKFNVAPKPATTAAAAPLVAAEDFKIHFDKQGQPYSSVSKLAGAKGYEVWFCESDPSIESNWNFLTWSTNCQGIYLTGLNRTKTNYLRLRGKRGNSLGPWSNLVVLPSV